MNAALLSLSLPLVAGLLLVLLRPGRSGLCVIGMSAASLIAAAFALQQTMQANS